jgi:glucose/mannose transport system substrate-binding protein
MRTRGVLCVSVLVVLAFVFVGCGAGSDGEGGSGGGEVEIFSWWTGAGEEDALNALIDYFKEQYPDVEVENAAVAGGAGTNAKAVLANRMQANDPPDTFQVHGGAELMGWVDAGKMQPLNDLYEEQGWSGKFPEELVDMVSKDGDPYSVPVNIHRGNVLWYNMQVFEENGLEPPTTFEEFFAVADELQAAGVTPLALGDKEPWAAVHLFEDVLLGTLGPEEYKKLWTGELSFEDPSVREAVDAFGRMLEYVNDDHAARNWQDAAQLMANGDAAMNIMGDWAKGYFVNDLNLAPNEDFGWTTTPETEGSFMVVTDTFGLPEGADSPEDTRKFLSVLGSAEGQDVFNPLKGSIPARTDADVSKYDAYGEQTIEEYGSATLAPSLAHGSAAPEGFLTRISQAVNTFVTQRDTDQLVNALSDAAERQLK